VYAVDSPIALWCDFTDGIYATLPFSANSSPSSAGIGNKKTKSVIGIKTVNINTA